MNPPTAVPRRSRAFAAALSGCRATHINEFRRKSRRYQDILSGVGLPLASSSIHIALMAGQALTLLLVTVGMVWTPPRAGLTPLGIPLTAPDLAAITAILLATGLLPARRRFGRFHRPWAGISAALEAGMRSGTAVLDIGLALMLVVQNLRWGSLVNILAILSIVGALPALLAGSKSRAARTSMAFTAVAAVAGLLTLLGASPLATAVPASGQWTVPAIGIAALFLAVTAAGTPLLYALVAHRYALKSRGMLLDMGIKAGAVLVLASLAMPFARATPWPGIAPYATIAVFFLGLILFRSNFVRVSSPEAFGYALFLFRVIPHKAKTLIFKSLIITATLTLPGVAFVFFTLLLNGYPQSAVLFIALAVFEIGADALAIQRRTAVLPAAHLPQLPQRSKAGQGAALSAGMAVVLSGVFGGIIPGTSEPQWLAAVAGCLVVVAGLLIGVLMADTQTWLRDFLTTETEES